MKTSRLIFVCALSWGVFAWASLQMRDQPRLDREDLLSVRLPIPVQLAYAGGDPFLAANLNVFRSMMVGARVREKETYRIQGQLQRDAALLNPRHEDNYYVAAAMLPWNGQVAAAQDVLLHAANARDWDMWPPFFYAFNSMYFEHDMARAGHWAEVAAERHPRNASALRAMAARWYERGDDPQVALAMLRSMYEQSSDENFRAMLEARMGRLDGLRRLRDAAEAYRSATGGSARELSDLVGHAGLEALPHDPMELGYALNVNGLPVLVDHKTR